MTIKAVYESLDDIPEAHRELFAEKDGQFMIAVEGVRLASEVDAMERAMRGAKADREKLAKKVREHFGDRPFDEIRADLERLPELEAAAGNGGAEVKERAEALAASTVAPIQKELETTKAELAAAHAKIERGAIHDALRTAAKKAGVIDAAIEDVLLRGERVFSVGDDGDVRTKDGAGVTPYMDAGAWLGELLQTRPHWLPPSVGGGASGASGGAGMASNPWSAANWSLTQQGAFVRQHGAEKANQMAKAAGSKLGATAPPAG